MLGPRPAPTSIPAHLHRASQVYVAKPRSSRNSSIESFVVCRHFLPPPGIAPSHLRALLAGATIPEEGEEGAEVRQDWLTSWLHSRWVVE